VFLFLAKYNLFSGVNVAEHDWHHEKFFANYSLSYKYLDKVFGTYHAGRVPGEQGNEATAQDEPKQEKEGSYGSSKSE
jgi:sterol desaturase/sphingolipid hydroxylase (fatty acid hydroxylase superfamily)